MFRTSLLVVGLLLAAAPLRAQFDLPKPEMVKLVRALPLLVILEQEDERKLKKLAKKPAALEEYRQTIANSNARMQQLVPRYWKLSTDISFQTQPSYVQLLQQRKSTGPSCILQCIDLNIYQKQPGATQQDFQSKSQGNTFNYGAYKAESIRAIRLEVLADGRASVIAGKELAELNTTESDVILTLKTIQQFVLDLEEGKKMKDLSIDARDRGVRLQQKTLLFAQEDLEQGLTAADVQVLYPFPHQIVPRSVVDSAIAAGQAQYACIRQMPVNTLYKSYTVQLVVSVDDGMELAYSKKSNLEIEFARNAGADPLVIKKENLNDFARYAGGKVKLATWPPY